MDRWFDALTMLAGLPPELTSQEILGQLPILLGTVTGLASWRLLEPGAAEHNAPAGTLKALHETQLMLELGQELGALELTLEATPDASWRQGARLACLTLGRALTMAARQDALQERQALLTEALQAFPGLMSLHLPQSFDVVCASHMAEQLIGQQLAGRSMGSFLEPEALPVHLAPLLAVVQQRTILNVNNLEFSLDERGPRIYNGNFKPLIKDDTLLGILAYGEDVTELRHAIAGQRAIETRLNEFLETVEVAIFDYHLKTRQITTFQGDAQRIMGFVDEGWSQGFFDAIIHPSDLPKVTEHLQESVAEKTTRRSQFRIRHGVSNEIRWIEARFRPVPDQADPVVRGVAFDITAIKEMEQRLVQLRQLQSLGEMTASLTHDFNNMLAVVSGLSEMLLHEEELGLILRTDIEGIHDAASEATGMARQMMRISRALHSLSEDEDDEPPLRPEPTDLNTEVKLLGRMLRRTLPHHVALGLELAPELPTVEVDRVLLNRVIFNLVLNAQEALHEEGTVTISTRWRRNRRQIILSVSDNGVGMNPTERARIFNPYFTTKERQGNGLGLSVVRRFASHHGGVVKVSTTPGQGSTFSVVLPLPASPHELPSS